ncbi:MAG: hypothetical protein JWN96_2123 [Mycobacterium sp.]|nr:hypothetical protein [Mycobacterium sp.]
MTRRQRSADAPDKDKNISSPETVEPARPWTKEEMEQAKPLPLPSVEATPNVGASGFPYVGASGFPYTGTGDVKPAGRPERDE